jgi:hypothetical protein
VLEYGPCKATIRANRVRMLGDKIAVSLQCETADGDAVEVLVFVTEKSAGMARRQLKIAGFDIDANDLGALDRDRQMLSGNRVPLMIDEYKGKPQAKIDMDGSAPASALMSATGLLRNAKGSAKSGNIEEPPPVGDDEIPF